MRTIIYSLLFLVTHGIIGQGTKQSYKGVIAFVSEAPLEIIQASSKKLTGIIDTVSQQFAFHIKLKSFEGFNSALQKEHFHENYLESDKYPMISYSGRILDAVNWSKDGKYEVRSKGKFVIHGITKEKIIKSTIIVDKKNVTITSNFIIALDDFDIKIPSIVFQKIANEIKVTLSAKQEIF